MIASMATLQSFAQYRDEIARRGIGHGETGNNAAFERVTARRRQLHPSHQPHGLIRNLEHHAADEQARYGNRLRKRRLVLAVIQSHSRPPIHEKAPLLSVMIKRQVGNRERVMLPKHSLMLSQNDAEFAR